MKYEELTEESITRRVEEIIERVRILQGPTFKLIKVGKLNGKQTKIYCKCDIHGIVVETTYAKLKDTYRMGCPECEKEELRNSTNTQWWKSPEKSTELVLNTIDKLKLLGQDLEFIGVDLQDPNLFKDTIFNIIIRCKKHNEIGKTRISRFLRKGWNCKKCSAEITRRCVTLSPEEAYRRAVENKKFDYDYSRILTEYSTYEGKVTLICPIHGPFVVNYNTILRGLAVCPQCYEEYNRIGSENIVYSKLLKYFSPQDIDRKYKIPVKSSLLQQTVLTPDFYIKSTNQVIEFNGLQHYKFVEYFHINLDGFIKQVLRDNYLEEYCLKNNISLIKIPWVDRNRIDEILETLLLSKKDITTTIRPSLLPIPYHNIT